MGEFLAERIRTERSELKIDVVIPIPDSARPSAMELANRLGVPYREPGFASALAIAEAGGELHPNLADWIAYQRRGIERDAAGDYSGAAEDFAHAIRIGPPNTALRYLRGLALLHSNQPQEATKEFEEGLKLDPNNVTLRTLLQGAARISDSAINPSPIKASGDSARQ